MANIIFLGTAGNTSIVGKQLRSAGGIIIQIEDLQLHVDPGPGALQKARELGINLNNTTAVLISNNELINCNDLNVVVEAMTHSGIEHRGILLGSKSVFYNTEEHYPYLTKLHQKMVERVLALEKNHKVGLDLIEINSLSAVHHDPEALGFKFYCPKFTLSYSGDTGVTDQLLEQMSGSDIVILKVPFPGNKSDGRNLDREGAIKIVSHVRPRLAVITHFGTEMLKADPLQEAREIQRITGVQTIAARDGLLIAPDGYGQRNPVKGFE